MPPPPPAPWRRTRGPSHGHHPARPRADRRSPSRRLTRPGPDRGSVAVEFALAVPLLVLILVTLMQAFAWGVGHLAARAAADHATQTTRVIGGTEAAGRIDAAELLDQLAGRLVNDPTVTVTRGQATTTVTVRGTARGVPLPIEVTTEAPTERYT